MSFRSKRRVPHAVLMACAVIVGVLACTAQFASAFVACPSGTTRSANVDRWNTWWPLGREDPKGVTLCEGVGGAFSNTRGYLEIADLGDGARIRLHAELTPETFEESYLGWPDGLYRKRTAYEWYSWLRNGEEDPEYWSYHSPPPSRLFSVTNASFFSDTNNERYTTLSFPITTYGGMSTFGVAQRNYEEPREPRRFDWEQPKKALLIGAEFEETETQDVKINPFPTRYEYEQAVEDLEHVGGNPEVYDTADSAVSFTGEVRVGEAKRRTYVGVYGDTVYIWVTDDEFTNEQARATMLEINPNMDVIQMDGGGSSQFYSAYGSMHTTGYPILTERQVPSVLAVYRAE